MIPAVSHLPGNAAKIGFALAVRTFDDGARNRPEGIPPRTYFGSSRKLADAIGKEWIPEPTTPDQLHHNRKITKLVNEGIRVLKDAGIIRQISKAVNGSTAAFEVLPQITDLQAEIEATNFTLDTEQRTQP